MTAWQRQAWLVRYLDRQFASEEALCFEAYAMDSPELLATIEADTRLRDALTAASRRDDNLSAGIGGRRSGATLWDADGDRTGDSESPAANDAFRARHNSHANEHRWRHRIRKRRHAANCSGCSPRLLAGLQARHGKVEERAQLERQSALARIDQTDGPGSGIEIPQHAFELARTYAIGNLVREHSRDACAGDSGSDRGLCGVDDQT
jgi:hypothetical protein